jgi:hypothetical protein
MKALRKSYFILALAIFFSAIILVGCSGASNKDKQANQQVADSVKKALAVSPEANNALYQFPTPFEVTKMLEKAKAGFIFDITNPVDNVGKYMTEKSRALNLGIYSADLAYSATYNRIDETNKFLGCTSKLADQLGIAGVYDQSLVDKVKKFNNNKDSLVSLVNKVFSATNDFLSKNNRNQISVMIATGGFVEGLYLAASLNMVAKDNKQISTIIANQKENLDKLLFVLDAYKQDENIKSLGEEVAKLKPIFTDYGLEADKKLPRDKAGQISDLAESVRVGFIR